MGYDDKLSANLMSGTTRLDDLCLIHPFTLAPPYLCAVLVVNNRDQDKIIS